MRKTFLATRLLAAMAIIAAIAAQLHSSVSFASRDGTPDSAAVIINFFSYFTVDSNTLSAAMLILGAIRLWGHPRVESRGLTVARASVTVYMIVTGAVYNLLLRESVPHDAIVGWSNEILHVAGPIYLVLDWFLAPGRSRLWWRDALTAIAFPVVWVVYTLARGPIAEDPFLHTDHWYPYPFINRSPRTADTSASPAT